MINKKTNSTNYPTFYPYFIFKNKNYGLEFINLNQTLSENQSGEIINQINGAEFEVDKYIYLCDREYKIKIKIIVIKKFYK